MSEGPTILNDTEQLQALVPHCFYVLYVDDEEVETQINRLDPLVKEAVGRFEADGLEGLQIHGDFVPEVVWVGARTVEEAKDWLVHVDQLEPTFRGFDAVFCDIKLSQGYDGFDVAEAAAGYKWPCAVIGYTAFASNDDLLKAKLSYYDKDTLEDRVFDEFLNKTMVVRRRPLAVAKLKSALVPTSVLAKLAERWGCFFYGKVMWRLLRDLALVASRPALDEELPRILLLGEPGTGKGMSVRAYLYLLLLYRTLRVGGQPDVLSRLITVNCATLVKEGEGGRARLFGFKSDGRAGVPNQRGVFERATGYEGGRVAKERSSVVLLDEFVQMPWELQASILNTLDERMVTRQSGGDPLQIWCPVAFATNFLPSDNGSQARQAVELIRPDILDRIPFVFEIPPLRLREDSEILYLIKSFAVQCLRNQGCEEPEDGVIIEDSAKNMIIEAIRLRVIRSIRQLQAIATVRHDEWMITDGNLRWMAKKLRVPAIASKVAGLPARRDSGPEAVASAGAILELVWTNGDVVELTTRLNRALERAYVAGVRGVSFERLVYANVSQLSPATKELASKDRQTWARAVLRLLCNLGSTAFNRNQKLGMVVELPPSSGRWAGFESAVLAGFEFDTASKSKVMDWLLKTYNDCAGGRRNFKVIDFLGGALPALAGGAWPLDGTDAGDDLMTLAQGVFPDFDKVDAEVFLKALKLNATGPHWNLAMLRALSARPLNGIDTPDNRRCVRAGYRSVREGDGALGAAAESLVRGSELLCTLLGDP